MITNSSPLSDILHDVIIHVCVTNKSPLPIYGTPSNGLMIHVHAKPPNLPEQIILANEIGTRHSQLNNSSRFKIIRNIQIHPENHHEPKLPNQSNGIHPKLPRLPIQLHLWQWQPLTHGTVPCNTGNIIPHPRSTDIPHCTTQ